jgi:hypothetical protein
VQVNVFVTRIEGQLQMRLLVLPLAPQAAIPKEFRDGWTYFATVDTHDKLLAASAAKVEADIGANGYAVVEPTG